MLQIEWFEAITFISQCPQGRVRAWPIWILTRSRLVWLCHMWAVGGSSVPELGVAAFGSFGCGTEVLLVSLRGRLSAGGSLSPRGGRHSWPHILGPAASVLKARCGEARADRCVPHLASRQVDPDPQRSWFGRATGLLPLTHGQLVWGLSYICQVPLLQDLA